MSILIRRLDGNSFGLITGKARLRIALDLFGKATVIDAETHETFEVHEVDGEIVILDNGSAAIAQTIAANAIERAAQR
jgi:hypothetical protein